jgi:hypothetical protein
MKTLLTEIQKEKVWEKLLGKKLERLSDTGLERQSKENVSRDIFALQR